MNVNNKAIRLTVIGGLATLLLALVVVLMANPAAASGSGDWPPPATGDWVINQPTTVIDESFVYLLDQNIIVNSQLTVYNSLIVLDATSWPSTYYTVKISPGGTLVANETDFDSWPYINLQVDGTLYITDTIFWYLQDFNISARGVAYVEDYSRFRFINNEVNVAGTLELDRSYIDQTYVDINVGGTLEMNYSSIYNTMNDFNIDGSVEMYNSYIYYTYNDVNIGGYLYMNNSRIYDTYHDINIDGKLDLTYYSYLYYTDYDVNIDGTVNMDRSYIYYTYGNINVGGNLNTYGSTIDETRTNITVSGNLDMFQSYLYDCYGTLVISGTSTMDGTRIDDIDRGFWISGKVDFNDTDVRYVNYAFNVTGMANLEYVRFYRIYDGMNLMGAVDMAYCDMQYVYKANYTGAVDIGYTRWYYMYDGVRLTGEVDIDTCEIYYVRLGVYIGSDDVNIANCNFYNMYYSGIYIDDCSPSMDNVTIRVSSSYSYDVYFTTDRTWSAEDRFPMAVGNGIWVDGGVPSFNDVSVEADNRVNFRVDYTGTEREPTIYLLGMVCPVLIDSPEMDVVSGLTVHDSAFNAASYTTATDPGMNPLYLYVDFMIMSAGIGVVNYDDTTITDVVAYNNYYSSIYGPYIYGAYYGYSGRNSEGPRVNVGAGVYGASSTQPDPILTVRDVTVDDGTDWFGHMYYTGYSGTGMPTLSDTVVIQNVTVKRASGTVFGFEIQPSYPEQRMMDLYTRITDCTFTGIDGEIMAYYSNAGPGIDPDTKMLDVTEDIIVDNNTIDECFSGSVYFYIDSVWMDHRSDKWDRTLTFADNDFVNSHGTLFYAYGLDYYDKGTCTLNVINNNMVNVTDGPNANMGPYYSYDYDVVRFIGNTMTDMMYSETGDFYDWGGDDGGVKPVDWRFKDNVITNCTNERWSEIIFIEFGGAVLVEGNQMSGGNGFLSMWHETMYTGWATLDIVDNEFYQMAAYMAEFGNTDQGNKDFMVTVKDNTVYECADFFLNFWGSASNINPYDWDATYVIEDNLVHNNTGGFIHVWGKVTVRGNDFFDNAGPLLYIQYINLNPPVVSGNRMADNKDLFVFEAKDKGFELVSFAMSDEMLSCTGTAFSFTNMEVTFNRVDISGAARPIRAQNTVVNAYSSTIDGSKCRVVGDGAINTWWPMEVKVTWGDDEGTDSKTPVSEALVVFYDANDVYYTSVYAGTDGILPEALYKQWTVDTGGLYMYSPYEVKAASSGATNDTFVTLNMEMIGPNTVYIVLWDAFAPVVAITEPYDGANMNRDSLVANGFVTEVGSGLDTIEYSLTGSTWMPLDTSDEGDWDLVLSDLGDGDITIWVRASDIASNQATTSITITVDTVAPDLTIGNVPERTKNPLLIITGTIEVGSDLYLDGAFLGTAESSSLTIEYTLHEGTNAILIEAMDAAGNIAFEALETILDTKAPTLVLTGPAHGTVTNQDAVSVTGIVEPGATLTVGGTPVIAGEDGSFSHSYTLSSGDNTIEVKATDLANNMATTTVLVKQDLVPPSVSIADPSGDITTGDTFIEVNIHADADAMLWLNGRPTTNDGDFWRTVLLLEGLNTITVKGMDPAGNVAEDSVVVKRDTMPPRLVVEVPSALVVWTNQNALTVSGLAFNATEGVFVNGEEVDSYNPQTGAFSHSATLTSGENDITVEAKDEVHVVSHEFKAMMSIATPKLVVNTVESPATTSSVTISGETDAGIATVVTETGGVTKEFPVNYDGSFSFTMNFEDGSYSVKVVVQDKYGNMATEQSNTFDVKEKNYFPDGGDEDGGGVTFEPMHIGLLLAVIGITLIVAALWATWKISRRGE